MFRAYALSAPTLVKEPAAGRIAEIGCDGFHCFPANRSRRPPEAIQFLGLKSNGLPRGCNSCLPQNFVCHPIPDAGEAGLEQETCFDRQALMPVEESRHDLLCKRLFMGRSRDFPPPLWLFLSDINPHAAKLPRISKHKRYGAQEYHEMIVFVRPEGRRFAAQITGHPEVNSHPDFPAKLKQHLLAARPRPAERLVAQRGGGGASIEASKDSCPGVQLQAIDALTQASVPLPAIVFDLSQFRHAAP